MKLLKLPSAIGLLLLLALPSVAQDQDGPEASRARLKSKRVRRQACGDWFVAAEVESGAGHHG